MLDVLSEIAHAGPQRGAIIRQLIRRKLHENDSFYRIESRIPASVVCAQA